MRVWRAGAEWGTHTRDTSHDIATAMAACGVRGRVVSTGRIQLLVWYVYEEFARFWWAPQ